MAVLRQRLLWVTRSSPFNLLTAQRLRAMGHGVVTMPLFDIRPLPAGDDGTRPDLIAFTSVHGVRHHPHQPEWSSVPVFAVGDATAAAARRFGYGHVHSANGNLRDLQALILRSAPTGSRLIHFCAREPAGDLAAYLRCRGFEADRRNVYEAVARPLAELRGLLLDRPKVQGIVVHSPKAGQRAAELVADSGWLGTVFCLSEACAQDFRGIARVVVKCAPRPTERALMETIRQATGGGCQAAATVFSSRLKDLGRHIVSNALEGANDNDGPAPTPA